MQRSSGECSPRRSMSNPQHPCEGKHVTLIACIPLKEPAVRLTYIIPSLPQRAKLEEYGLDNVKLYVQPSGFQTGEIFSRWIEDVFVPHVDNIRISPWQRALLIVDAHALRLHPEAQLALMRNKS